MCEKNFSKSKGDSHQTNGFCLLSTALYLAASVFKILPYVAVAFAIVFFSIYGIKMQDKAYTFSCIPIRTDNVGFPVNEIYAFRLNVIGKKQGDRTDKP